jgi:uncharacterized membrane protein (DUF485 family)
MQPSHRQLLDSPDFHRLVNRRLRVSLVLTALLFLLYYGFILLIAADKALLSTRIGEVTTLGIPLAAAVILGAWVLTAVYVIWANRSYDADVLRLRQRLDRAS